MTIYDFNVIDIDGNTISLEKYKGRVLLIVNVASECGFTPQYFGLQKLYEKYEKQGLSILAFPCNQFRQQEPKSNEEIKIFCQGNYNVTFDMFSKIDVNATNTLPLYKFLKQQKGGFLNNEIKWNFTKFLISRDGKVIDRFAPITKPQSIIKQIETLL